MNYIANNIEINDALKHFYNRDISALEIADIYFNNRLYSAASSFYNVELFDILNTNEYKRKSYCFQKMGECYLNQQSDQQFSGWQLEMIYELFSEALNFDMLNYHAYIGMIKCLILQGKKKDAYHYCNKLMLHIKIFNINEKDYDSIYDICFTLYDLAEEYFIIKYDYFNNNILSFFTSINYDIKKIYKLMERINKHIDIDNFEKDIIEGNIYVK